MLDKGSLQNKFEHYGSKPSDELWGSISAELNQKASKKRAIIWWMFGTGMAACLLVVFRLTLLSPEPDTALLEPLKLPELHQYPAQKHNENEPVFTHENDITETKQNKINKNSKIQTQPITKSIVNPVQNQKSNLSNNNNKVIPESSQPDIINTNPSLTILVASSDPLVKMKPNATPLLALNRGFAQPESVDVLAAITTSKWELDLDVQHDFGWRSGMLNETVSANNLGSPVFDSNGNANTSLDPSFSLPAFAPSNFTSRRPLRLRAEILYRFHPRLFVQSGINLAWINSKYTYTSFYTTRPKVNTFSISLPVRIGFQIISKKRWGAYVKAGNLFELPVFTTSNFDKVLNQESLDYSANVQTPFLKALEFDLGINYAINENLKLNLSPGMKWYYGKKTSPNYYFPVKSRRSTLRLGIQKTL